MTLADDILVYDHDGSPCVRRVKIALMEKGLPFRIQTVDLSQMQQKSPEYLRINPNGLVPALNHNGFVMYESSVINDYLEEQFPQIPLRPRTAEGRAQANFWQQQELAMAKVFRTLMYARVVGPLKHFVCSQGEYLQIARQSTSNPAHLAWEEKVWSLQVLSPAQQRRYQKQLYTFVDQVERALQGRHYLVEDQFSFADIAVYPRVRMFEQVDIPITEYSFPNLYAWCRRIEERRSIQETAGDTQGALDKLSRIGVLGWLNRIGYQPETVTWRDRLLMKALKPVMRKKLHINEALRRTGQASPMQLQSVREAPIDTRSVDAFPIDPTLFEQKPVLYGYQYSPVTQRVRSALSLLKLEYEYREVDMARLEHCQPAFLAINPAAELPVLLHGPYRFVDAMLMVEYLNALASAKQQAPGDSESLLFPQMDTQTLARIRMWNAFDLGMHKEYRPLFYRHRLDPEQALSVEERQLLEQTSFSAAVTLDWIRGLKDFKVEQVLPVFEEKMQILEQALKAQPFLAGEFPSYADLIVSSRLQTFPELGLGSLLEERPEIQQWLQSVEKRLLSKTTRRRPSKKRQARGKVSASEA